MFEPRKNANGETEYFLPEQAMSQRKNMTE